MLKQLYSRNIHIPTILYSSDEIELTDELTKLGVVSVIWFEEKDLKTKIDEVRSKINIDSHDDIEL